MNAEYLIGCCGWSEAQPKYVKDFATIELQTTFYQPPADAVAKRWRELAPAGFRYCMKAWQLITHTPSSPTYRRLKSPVSQQEQELYGSFRETEQVWLAWERTREIAKIIDAQVIVFQCPKSFLPTRENLRNIRKFFSGIERDQRTLAWEPRGPDWRPELIRDLCTEHDLIHCVDPFGSVSAHGQSLYWRLHGKGSYHYRYTDSDLQELRAQLQTYEELPGPNFILFNNIYSKVDSLRFLRLIAPGPNPR